MPGRAAVAIAIAKATTANGFSNSQLSLSTANLYAATQPDGSLAGLNQSNPFNPVYLQNDPTGRIPGGVITFGGGVALYNGSGKVIGALGVSGDSSCADHAIAFRMRKLGHFDHLPGGNSAADNIVYGPPYDGSQQPHCNPQDLTPEQVVNIPGIDADRCLTDRRLSRWFGVGAGRLPTSAGQPVGKTS